MSRCFPYPPPGYEKSLALIESIKLQKEREKTEKERKKREKKEKKDKPKGDRPKSEEKKKHKKRHREEPSKSTRKPEDENEQLERSSLTEEHGCPAAAAQILYDSSDSTQDSSKRIVPLQDVISSEPSAPNKAIKRSRPDLSDVTAQGAAKRIRQDPADAAAAAHGSGIRIRLPLLRHAESPTASGDQPCFSGRTSEERAAAPPPSYSGPPSFSGRPAEIVSSAAEQRPGETSLRDDPKQRKQSSKSSRKSSGGRAQEIHRQYKKLVRDWTPPPLLAERPLDEDLDWLAERRQGPAAAAAVDGGEGPLCLRPGRASYAPEFGVHVLPYVVPF